MSSSLASVSNIDVQYAARMAWRHRLSEKDCRELASEYMRGMRDQCTLDAYEEFVERYGDPTLPPEKQSRSKLKGKAKRRR